MNATLSVIESILIILTMIVIAFPIARKSRLSPQVVIALAGWHTALCIFAWWYATNFGGDEPSYYEGSLSGYTATGQLIEFGTSTMFIYWLTSIFTGYLGTNFFNTYLCFNVIGTLALVLYAATLSDVHRDAGKPLGPLFWVIAFMPSISFWTVWGKDAIAFFAVALYLRAASAAKFSPLKMGFSVLLMTLVRPHVGAVMLLAAAVRTVARRRLSWTNIATFVLAAGLAAAVFAPLVASLLGISELSVEALSDYSESKGKDAVIRDDAALWYNVNPLVRMLMTAFYPTLFNASGALQYVVAAENVILMAATVALVWLAFVRLRVRSADLDLWVYAIATWAILGLFMYNSGLASRQKWMFLDVILVLFLRAIIRPNKRTAANVSPKPYVELRRPVLHPSGRHTLRRRP